jgi:ppGpp synthetase/RelA/SpoT-type nucleotidyltranferase
MTSPLSKSSVERAGKLLALNHPTATHELIEAFKTAHKWRDGHIVPMRRLRDELSIRARKVDPDALTAGRLKRMKSIRRKLPKLSLARIQDIAGCRAILATAAHVNEAAEAMAQKSKHEFVRENDYLSCPKLGGYRSRHLIFRVESPSADGEPAKLVEIQLRTRLQHSWATAVEAVGLVRGEDLKGGRGDVDWLRFFALMSSELSFQEGLPSVPETPTTPEERAVELRALDHKLSALSVLDSYRRIIDATAAGSASTGSVFMIQYDNDTKQVRVKPFSSLTAGSRWYSAEEQSSSRSKDTVLVEVDRAADLRAAYPNYYLDVGEFATHLSRALGIKPRLSSWKPDFRWWWE